MQLDADFIARHDVGDVHCKHVGFLLGQHRSCFAFAFGRLKFFFCFFFLFDSCRHALAADLHLHSVDGNFGGGRKNIAGIDGGRSLVCVSLYDISVRDNTVDRDVDTCFFQWKTVHADFFAFYIEVWRVCPVLVSVRFACVHDRRAAKQHAQGG